MRIKAFSFSLLVLLGLDFGRVAIGWAEPDSSPSNQEIKLVLGLFTNRNRVVYRQGEVAPVHVVIQLKEPPTVPIPATLSLALRDTGSNTKPFPLASFPIKLKNNQTITIDVYTQYLRPGKYTLTATLARGGLRTVSRACSFEVAEKEPLTPFTIYLDQPGGGFGESPIDNEYASVEEAVRDMSATGFNLIFDMIYIGFTSRTDKEAITPKPPVFGIIPEETFQPLREDRMMQEALRYRSRIGLLIGEIIFNNYVPVHPYNPVFTATSDEWRERTVKVVQHITNIVGRYPNFFGYNYGLDQAVGTRYWASSEEIWNAYHRAITSAYQKRFGELPQEDREKDPEAWWKWRKFLEYDCVSSGLKIFTQAVKKIVPWAKCSTHQAAGDVMCQNHPASAYGRVLDFAFGYPVCEFNNRAPARAQWVTDCIRAAHLDMLAYTTTRNWSRDDLQATRREMLLSIATGSDGVGVSDWTPKRFFADRHYLFGKYIKRFFRLLHQQGDLFTRLEPADEVAILASYPETVFGKRSVGAGWWSTYDHQASQIDSTYTAYQYVLFAGHTPRIITEENILRGDLKRFKVLLLCHIGQYAKREYGKALEQKIAEFAKAGGTVIADALTTLKIPSAKRLSYAMPNSPFDGTNGSMTDRVLLADKTQKEIQELKAILDHCSPVLASTDRFGILLIPQRSTSSARYFFVIDYLLPSSGLSNVRAVPTTCQIKVPANTKVVYDLFEGKRIKLTRQKDSAVFTADLTKIEGKLYALLPADPDSLQVTAQCTRGKLIINARLLAKGIRVKADLPLEVRVTDAIGKERLHMYRAFTNGTYTYHLPLGVNEQKGLWTVTLHELTTGLTGVVKIKVAPPIGQVCTLEPEVYLEPGVVDFLRSLREAKIILQTPSQDPLEAQANRLKGVLAAKGITTFIVKGAKAEDVAEEMVVTDGSKYVAIINDYPHIKGAVIVLGLPSENFLLQYLAKENLLPRRLSENYPGPGNAWVGVIYGAFEGGSPVLIVAGDPVGIDKAVKALGNPVAPARTVRGVSTSAIQKIVATGISFRKPNRVSMLDSWSLPVSTLAVSADGSLVVAGQVSYGENLFALEGKKGTLLWKTHAACYSPERVQIGKDRILLGSSMRRHREWFTEEGISYDFAKAPLVYLEPEEELVCLGQDGKPRYRAPNWKDSVLLPDGGVFYGGWQMVSQISPEGKEVFSGDEWFQRFDDRQYPAQMVLSPDGTRVAYLMKSASGEAKRLVLYDTRKKALLFDIPVERVAEVPYTNLQPVGFAGGEVAYFADGRVTYVNEKGEVSFRTPVINAQGLVFLRQSSQRPNNALLAIDHKQYSLLNGAGQVLWKGELPGNSLLTISEVKELGQRFIVRDAEGFLFALGPSGKIEWQAPVDEVNALAIADGAIYAGTEDGRILKLNDRGQILWSRRLQGEMIEMPPLQAPEVQISRPTGTPVTGKLPSKVGENLARQAKVTISLAHGDKPWVTDGSFLVDGKVEERHYSIYPRDKWQVLAGIGFGGLCQPATVELEFPQPVRLSAVAIHDGKKEKPYTIHGITFQPNPILRRWLGKRAPANLKHSAIEFKLEAEVEGGWVLLAQVRDNTLPYHIHTFTPVTTRRIRYTTTVTGDDEFWMEEIEAYGSPSSGS